MPSVAEFSAAPLAVRSGMGSYNGVLAACGPPIKPKPQEWTMDDFEARANPPKTSGTESKGQAQPKEFGVARALAAFWKGD